VTLTNALVALNRAGNAVAPDCGRSGDGQGFAIHSAGHNLLGNGQDCALAAQGSDCVGTRASLLDPCVAARADHGGVTWTHALLAGSPAVDRGEIRLRVR
jgi:hypothetical protein